MKQAKIASLVLTEPELEPGVMGLKLCLLMAGKHPFFHHLLILEMVFISYRKFQTNLEDLTLK
jgi:hypothetical protein